MGKCLIVCHSLPLPTLKSIRSKIKQKWCQNCPDCKRPLAAGRHSSTTEKRTGLASELTFKCGCRNKVVMLTSKKINKVYEVNRRFPLAIFAIGRHQTHDKKCLGNMNMPGSLNNTSWSNHKKQILKATVLQTIANLWQHKSSRQQ